MAKLDPRADPLSDPPTSKDDFSVDRVEVVIPAPPKAAAKGLEGASEPAKTAAKSGSVPPGEPEPAEAPAKSGSVPAGKGESANPPARVDSLEPPATDGRDPRHVTLEKLLDLNDWKQIGVALDSFGDPAALPPNLGLVAALAHNENAKDGDPDAVVNAIRSMAALLGVSEGSPMARVLARRMLRKNPVRFSERKAPAARTSLLIVLATLVVGGGVGWLASIGSWRGIAALLHR
jgi:hypothetical protein